MPIPQRSCANHPDRLAIGVCVITRKPICAECSTRYEGVNYSKEGLRIVEERRKASAGAVGWGARLISACLWLAAPALLFLLYRFYLACCLVLIAWEQREW